MFSVFEAPPSRPSIKLEEVTTAITATKLKKSPGPDGILPEVLVYGGCTLISFLLTIFNLFWISAKLPSDLTDAIIRILFKKGDLSDCGNYRGISLLSVVGKTFADIVLQRLKRLAELVYPNLSQATETAEAQLIAYSSCVK